MNTDVQIYLWCWQSSGRSRLSRSLFEDMICDVYIHVFYFPCVVNNNNILMFLHYKSLRLNKIYVLRKMHRFNKFKKKKCRQWWISVQWIKTLSWIYRISIIIQRNLKLADWSYRQWDKIIYDDSVLDSLQEHGNVRVPK